MQMLFARKNRGICFRRCEAVTLKVNHLDILDETSKPSLF